MTKGPCPQCGTPLKRKLVFSGGVAGAIKLICKACGFEGWPGRLTPRERQATGRLVDWAWRRGVTLQKAAVAGTAEQRPAEASPDQKRTIQKAFE